MILLQLSAGQGPLECARAVSLALKKLQSDCESMGYNIDILEFEDSEGIDCIKSVLVKISGNKVDVLADSWDGVMLWSCTSPFRPKHKRKNWFFSGKVYQLESTQFDDDIHFQTCRSSGAGGQHVNTTDSAVKATHVATGLSVRVESQRSQHANKRMAITLLMKKLADQNTLQQTQQGKDRWSQHQSLERGNPKRVFKGEKFL